MGREVKGVLSDDLAVELAVGNMSDVDGHGGWMERDQIEISQAILNGCNQ